MGKKLGAVVLIMFCLTSCGFGGIEVKTVKKEYDTDYSTVRADTAEIYGLKNKDFGEELNAQIAKDIESAVIAFDTEASASEDNVRMGNKCVFEDSWQVKYNKNGFLSLVEERYEYLGGAHGQTVRLPLNIDTEAGKVITLGDLFADSGYESTLNRMISEIVTEKSEEYSELWEKPQIKNSNKKDFYIENNDLIIFYQPYDLSYYARGFVEFKLPLKELSGYLKEEYRRLV